MATIATTAATATPTTTRRAHKISEDEANKRKLSALATPRPNASHSCRQRPQWQTVNKCKCVQVWNNYRKEICIKNVDVLAEDSHWPRTLSFSTTLPSPLPALSYPLFLNASQVRHRWFFVSFSPCFLGSSQAAPAVVCVRRVAPRKHSFAQLSYCCCQWEWEREREWERGRGGKRGCPTLAGSH